MNHPLRELLYAIENHPGRVKRTSEVMPLAPDVPTMSPYRTRWLLNQLVKDLGADEAYLEIGTWQGATLISALWDNPLARGYACDNFSQFNQIPGTGLWEGVRPAFLKNMARYQETGRLGAFSFFDEDCFALAARAKVPVKAKDGRPFGWPIGVFFYDGDHSRIATARAFVDFQPFLAREVIVIVDDWNYPSVRAGAWAGIEGVNPLGVWFRVLPAVRFRDADGNGPKGGPIYGQDALDAEPNLVGSGGRDGGWRNGLGCFHLTLRKG